MAWRQFVMHLDTLQPERVEEVFANHGADAITYTDAGDDPVLEPGPGETPLWQRSCISGLFPQDTDLALLHDDLLRSLDLDCLPQFHVETLVDRDWEREWLKDFRAMQFGRRLWVIPADSEIDDDDAVVVRLDPGLAFGTGTHATTRLCLEWLDGLDLRGKHLLDYGCGSGILSIAALKIGASSVTALDIDPQAITATHRNAARNDTLRGLTTLSDPAGLKGPYDVVIANILAKPLMELAERICSCTAVGSGLALSGILRHQADAVMQAYRPWIEFAPVVTRNGWVRLSGVKS